MPQPQLRQAQGLGSDILGELRHNAGSVLQQAMDPMRQALGPVGTVMTGMDALTGLARGLTVPLEQRDPGAASMTPEHVRQRGDALGDILSGIVPLPGEQAAEVAGKVAQRGAEAFGKGTQLFSAAKLARETGIPVAHARAVTNARVGDVLRAHMGRAGKGDELLLTDFSGRLQLPHGSSDPQLHGFEAGGPSFRQGMRYGGGEDNTFGNEGAYLDVSGKFTGGEMSGFYAPHIYETDAPFKKAFVLTPKSVPRFNELVGHNWRGLEDEYGMINRGVPSGEVAVSALKKHGYDGLIVHGFDDMLLSPFREMDKLGGTQYDKWWGTQGQSAHEKMRALSKSQGIPEIFQQDQVVHFAPENIKVGRKIKRNEIPELAKFPTTRKRVIAPQTREEAFNALASAQRGHPEEFMKHAQRELRNQPSGPLWGSMLEQAGDLTHRMAERGGKDTGFGIWHVNDKIEKLLGTLSNQAARDKIMEIPIDDFHAVSSYVEEHGHLKTYNEMQDLAKQVAIDIGKRNFAGAQMKLMKIRQAIEDGTYRTKAAEWKR